MSFKYLYPNQRGPLRPINVPQFHTKMYHLKTKISENCSSFTYATYRDCYWDWSNAVDHGWTEILLLWPKNLYRKGVGHIWQLPLWLGFIKEAMVKIWVGGGSLCTFIIKKFFQLMIDNLLLNPGALDVQIYPELPKQITVQCNSRIYRREKLYFQK